MPWLVAAHQAPVLPLKRRWPGIFSGLALVLGTLAPDLTFILRLDPRGTPASHTLLGQLYLTVPIVLALHALLTALVLPWLLPHLPGGPPLHLHALARCRPATDGLGLARVALSGLVGGLTHVFLDGFTHAGDSGWALVYLPWLATIVPYPAGGTAPLYESLQVWLTLGLGILALRQWNDLARRPPPHGGAAGVAVQPAPRAARRAVGSGLLAAGLAGAALGPVLRGAVGEPEALKLSAYGLLTFAAVAGALGAFADRARLVMDRVQLEVGVSFEA